MRAVLGTHSQRTQRSGVSGFIKFIIVLRSSIALRRFQSLNFLVVVVPSRVRSGLNLSRVRDRLCKVGGAAQRQNIASTRRFLCPAPSYFSMVCVLLVFY
jgi:hypothetical protein